MKTSEKFELTANEIRQTIDLADKIAPQLDEMTGKMHYAQHIGEISHETFDVLVDLTIKYKWHLMEIFKILGEE